MNKRPSCTFFYFLVLSCTFFLAGFLLFFRLGETSFVNWDEAWIASVSQDIAGRNDWLGGQWNGQTWFYEPPLVTWTLAVLYKIFGPSEFWLRSFNAFLGLLIIIVVYKLSILIAKSAAPAFIGVIILLSDIEFLFRGRQINVEIPVTFFLLLTIFFVLKTLPRHPEADVTSAEGSRRDSSSANRRILAGVSLGLAFLTKRASPILILPAISCVFFTNFTKKNIKYFFIFLITFIIVTLPWYFVSYLKWENQFINEFFLGYTLGKIRSVNPGAGTDIWFYITSLRHAFKFWFPLIPFAIVWAAVKSFRDRKIAVLTVFILSFLIFLTAAPIKSSWFLLPIHPAIAVILGLFIENLLQKSLRATEGSVAISPGLPRRYAPRNDEKKFPSCTFLYLFVLFCTFSLSAFQLIRYRRDFIVPDTTEHQAALAKLAGQLTPPQKPIYLDDDYLPVAVFYSQRRVVPLRFNRLQPLTPLPIPSGSYILTNKETFPTLQNNYPNISSIKDSADLILARNH